MELLTAVGRQLGNHLWQSTLFAAGIGIVAQTFRTNQARVFYWLWLAASLKFLAPFSFLSVIGWRLGSRLAPALPEQRVLLVGG